MVFRVRAREPQAWSPVDSYSRDCTDSAFNPKGSSRPSKGVATLGIVYIPYVKGVSEKFKHIGNWYNIRTILRTKHTNEN
jgi:hypothetical protein